MEEIVSCLPVAMARDRTGARARAVRVKSAGLVSSLDWMSVPGAMFRVGKLAGAGVTDSGGSP